MSEVEQVEVAKWYTHVRRIPIMLGSFSDGSKVPGGPYSISQAAGGLVFFIAARATSGLWSLTGVAVLDLVLAAAAAWGVAWGVGRIDTKGRNPLRILAGLYRVLAAPSEGTIQGVRAKPRRPHLVGHAGRSTSTEPSSPRPLSSSVPAPRAEPEPTPAPPAVVDALPASPTPSSAGPLTGVQRLLAARES